MGIARGNEQLHFKFRINEGRWREVDEGTVGGEDDFPHLPILVRTLVEEALPQDVRVRRSYKLCPVVRWVVSSCVRRNWVCVCMGLCVFVILWRADYV